MDSEAKKSAGEQTSDNDFPAAVECIPHPNCNETPLFQWLDIGSDKDKLDEISTEDQNKENPMCCGVEKGLNNTNGEEMWQKLNRPSLFAYLIATNPQGYVSQRQAQHESAYVPMGSQPSNVTTQNATVYDEQERPSPISKTMLHFGTQPAQEDSYQSQSQLFPNSEDDANLSVVDGGDNTSRNRYRSCVSPAVLNTDFTHTQYLETQDYAPESDSITQGG